MKQEIQKRFIETFNQKQKIYFHDYVKARALIESGKGPTEISRRTNIHIHRIGNWTRKDRNRPFSIRCYLKAVNRGYFELDDPKFEKLAYLVGYQMGDGNISRDCCKSWFYGVDSDLSILNDFIEDFGVSGNIKTYKINNGKMAVCDNAFTRLLISLGAPISDKTKQRTEIPKWIMAGNAGIKIKFLQGLFDSELNGFKRVNRGFSFQNLKFYTVKEKHYVKSGIAYLNQIKKVLWDFNISTSPVKKDRIYTRSRDNSIMIQIYFVIHSNYINLHKFSVRIGFLFNTKRKESVDKVFNEIEILAKNEIDKIEKYKQAVNLRKTGMSAYKISKELDLPIHSAKNWLYRKHKPRLLCSFEGQYDMAK